MNKTAQRIGGSIAVGVLAGTSIILAPMGAYSQNDSSTDANIAYGVTADNQINESSPTVVREQEVIGDFAFTQDVISPKEVIQNMFNRQTKVICGSSFLPASDYSYDDWSISVTGDVKDQFTVTMTELTGQKSDTRVMTCACSNNSAGGSAIINAQVKGVPIIDIIKRTNIMPDVNTVTFVAKDGSVDAFPLDYIISHNAILAYDLNDENIAESMGAINQLWIGSSAGKYFTKDVVEIKFTAEDEPSAAPSLTPTDREYVNRPNVGMRLAE